MTTALTIDVGLHGLGCGYYEGRDLSLGVYLPLPKGVVRRGPEGWRNLAHLLPLALDPDEVVLETMQVYTQAQWKGSPADILELQGACGAIAMRYPRSKVTGYLPQVWKGGVPADVFARRIAENIATWGWTDRVVLPATCSGGRDRSGDLYHGVGVGMHHLGWMKGGKTTRR